MNSARGRLDGNMRRRMIEANTRNSNVELQQPAWLCYEKGRLPLKRRTKKRTV
jgi:hypothetical protein